MLDLAPRLETLLALEPIVAWRAWSLTSRREFTHLRLRPIAGRSHPWPPMREAEARCKLARMHEAPNPDCSCGLHGAQDPDMLRRAKSPSVIGTVALWGRVVEHELGYRGQYAYPQRLRLACHLCLWRWGLRSLPPTVVVRVQRGRLVPLCDEHLAVSGRYGFPVRPISDARQVEADLLATYAVDLLPVPEPSPGRPEPLFHS